ncbi:MAG: ABC transporter permease [Lachnospiraceae bacterium]|nr:ABC transporter permease [Lachnospiraceae bacterium]
MNKLLSANFTRLKKDVFLKLCIIFMFAIGALLPVLDYHVMITYEFPRYIDESFFSYTSFMVILFSAFCSLFIGTEYSDGTIRNKLIVGHKRMDIYLSNLTACIIAGVIMCIAYLIPYLLTGIPLLGFFIVDNISTIWIFLGCNLVLLIALAAIFTLVSMLNQNKALSAVICILGLFVLLMLGAMIEDGLNQPEYFEDYAYMDPETKELVIEPSTANPYYIRGTQRQIYEFLSDFLPGSQIIRLSAMDAPSPEILAMYSGIIAVATTSLGIFFFGKEDIK